MTTDDAVPAMRKTAQRLTRAQRLPPEADAAPAIPVLSRR
jgi:hypothetical protein